MKDKIVEVISMMMMVMVVMSSFGLESFYGR